LNSQALLSSVGANVILPAYRSFKMTAEALHAATGVYAEAVAAGDPGAAAKLDTARAAWRAAMAAWQRAEVVQIGPAAPAGSKTGGQGLRDEIYSWPTVNTCRVDQEVAKGQYAQADFFKNNLVNVYGLAALEYLLFNQAPGSTCPPQVQAQAQAEVRWDALSAVQKTQKRADYAHAVGGNIAARARQLASAWEPAEGNFLGQLAGAGSQGSAYKTVQAALDELLAALFYIDLLTKDQKLAVPAGLLASSSWPSCGQAVVCPSAVESRWARHSKENVIANLEGFQRVFLGGDGAEAAPGFDDDLATLGAGELAAQMTADIAAAIAAAHAIGGNTGTLSDALAQDLPSVKAAHAAIKKITDQLKGEFATALHLMIPKEGRGDSD
jgi:predicted lipoprotein